MIRTSLLALARAVAGMRRHALAAALTTVSVALGLSLVATAMWVSDNVSSWSNHWRHGVDMIVYLERGVSEKRVEKLSAALLELEAVEGVERIASEVSLRRLERELGEEMLEGIDASALPTSLEVTLSDGVRDVVLAHPIVDTLRGLDGVEEVELLGAWVDDLNETAGGFEKATAVLIVLALLACIYVIFSTMRSRVAVAREEARVYELFSGVTRFVRAPLIAEGLLHGLLGAGVALLALWCLHAATSPALGRVALALFGYQEVLFLSGARIVVIMILGVAAGFTGAILATGRRALG